jgi:hypothetical protein
MAKFLQILFSLSVHGLLFSSLVIVACGDANVPLDADERKVVDSLAADGISFHRRKLDSLYRELRKNDLNRLVDSIKQQRLKEIAEQLKNVPK